MTDHPEALPLVSGPSVIGGLDTQPACGMLNRLRFRCTMKDINSTAY
jgi:hypothetical protein